MTIYKPALLTALLLPLALTACGGNTEGEGEATESELGDIDVLEGSVSDDMITLDRFGENPLAEDAQETDEDENGSSPAPAASNENATSESDSDDDNGAGDAEEGTDNEE
ncbi:hypothetical protein [Alterisphingorhabdus coralli]|uniref:DNA primase n=1 Tax=Alterisphingorhabdus coralli TaxID=3071408 RepID=A0AA97F8S1_9SPHN|nr:hypothetical protein [Parasphingorhabdus sp. SCSIO 66989]WOE75132.1 hypothetical protein RB602_15085 [Parasphingorhabdus sp. SCSIO 66989]